MKQTKYGQLPLNLQMFAESVESEGEHNAKSISNDNETADAFNPITSQADLDSHINKAVQKALINQAEKHKVEQEKAIAAALQKEKDYAQLSEKERKNKEDEDARKAFEKEREDFYYEKLINDVKGDLINQGLPADFAEFLAVRGDSEQSLNNVKAFKEAFDDAVSEHVKISLRQSDPGLGGGMAKSKNAGAALADRTGANINKKPF
ncbi:TPA: DUF4355 domain-containing protein [Streptococcus suis]